ncbi:N-acetyltransferase GCN5 [Burkholderia lata]|nr:N-acetyltransferase GCN5 [Burkholderia lata]
MRADLPFLLTLRRLTTTEHLQRIGTSTDDAAHDRRIRGFDARAGALHASPADSSTIQSMNACTSGRCVAPGRVTA